MTSSGFSLGWWAKTAALASSSMTKTSGSGTVSASSSTGSTGFGGTLTIIWLGKK